jgi:ribonuclease PH
MDREASRGKQSGRTLEIQRLIGRSLRAVIDMESLGERQIRIDCDVLQADGGTRTASITGGFLALYLALVNLQSNGLITTLPVLDQVAAVSCGIYNGQVLLDLDYNEDSDAGVDANFVLTGTNKIIEVQATAEDKAFDKNEFNELLQLAEIGISQLVKLQKHALGIE